MKFITYDPGSRIQTNLKAYQPLTEGFLDKLNSNPIQRPAVIPNKIFGRPIMPLMSGKEDISKQELFVVGTKNFLARKDVPPATWGFLPPLFDKTPIKIKSYNERDRENFRTGRGTDAVSILKERCRDRKELRKMARQEIRCDEDRNSKEKVQSRVSELFNSPLACVMPSDLIYHSNGRIEKRDELDGQKNGSTD